MSPLSRPQAETLLAPLRGGRALYDELRPAYVSLDPFVSLLRRRRFSGVILAEGAPGEGAFWLEEGQLLGAWLFSPGADAAAAPSDPLEVLRILWRDADARIAVHPGAPPPSWDAQPAAPAAPEVRTEEAPLPGPAPPPPLPSPPSRRRPPRAAPAAETSAGPRPVIHAQPRVRTVAPGEQVDPALAEIPWSRLLPEAVARVRRHRGTPLAQRLEEGINEAIAPAALAGREVRGEIDPRGAAGALRAVAEGLGAVAGAAFAERLLWTVGRDFACEDAVKRILGSAPPEGEA